MSVMEDCAASALHEAMQSVLAVSHPSEKSLFRLQKRAGSYAYTQNMHKHRHTQKYTHTHTHTHTHTFVHLCIIQTCSSSAISAGGTCRISEKLGLSSPLLVTLNV